MKRFPMIVGLLILVGVFAFSQEKTIVAAADPWPPFVDQKSPKDGLSLEVIRAAMKTQGYVVKMEYMPWARAEESVKNGTYDLLPDVWLTEERTQYLAFSDPYAANEVKFIKRKGDAFEYTDLQSLKGKTVGIVKGYGYGDAFSKSDLFKKEEVPDIITSVRKLLATHIDLTLEDQIVASTLISQVDPSLLDRIEFTHGSLSTNNLYIAVGRKNPQQKEIIAAFNRGLSIIKGDGTYNRILESHGIK